MILYSWMRFIGVTSGDFRLDISTPELHQVMQDGFAASESLLDMALQLERGSDAFGSSPVREPSKTVGDLSPQSTRSLSAWDFASRHSPAPAVKAAKGLTAWDAPSNPPLAPISPMQLSNAIYRVPRAGSNSPVSYSEPSPIMIKTANNQVSGPPALDIESR